MKKKILSLLLAMILVLGLAEGAFASTGDVTIYHADSTNGYYVGVSSGAYLVGSKVYYQLEEQMAVYDIASKETEYFDMTDTYSATLMDGVEPIVTTDEDGTEVTSYPSAGNAAMFAYNDELYTIVTFANYTDDGSTLDGGHIYKFVCVDGVVKLEKSDLPDLNWTDMIETYDTYSYSRYINSSFCIGDTLVATLYDDDGNYMLTSFDLKTGKATEHYIQDMNAATPAGDGQVLVETYMWGDGDNSSAEFLLYNLADDSSVSKGTMTITNYRVPANLYYNPETDTLYYTLDGEIWAAAGFDFENAVSVNDTPVESDSGTVAQVTEDGYMLLGDYQTIVLRSLNPDDRAEITLHISDYAYENVVETAYYKYTNENGNVSVVIDQGDHGDDVLQAMMNRSSSVDIYTMSVSSSQYSALFERGYMAELEGSEKLSTAITSMYSGLQSAVTKNGHIYALPLRIYGSSMGYNTKALEKLGMTEDDLPTTWSEFFDFLDELPSKLTDGCGVRAFENYYSQDEIKGQLFTELFDDYQYYLNNNDVQYSFNTSLFKSLIERIDQVDYDALGVAEQTYDEETGEWLGGDYSDDIYLFETYVTTTLQSGEGYNKPMMLTIDENAQKALNVSMYVAFINPFSEHIDEAIAYLETMAENLDTESLYNFYADKNDAVRYPDFEEYKQNLADWIEEAKEGMENTDDEDEKASYQESIDYYEQTLSEIDDTYWMFAPDAIASYRERAQYLTPITYDCTVVTSSSSDDDTVWSVISQYRSGVISLDEMLQSIDKKVQMMRLEGN
jgi:ABC-type glycerol-3-phosphate transport system substrate-binding protein